MEEKKTFYVAYRGYTYLYTPILANSLDEANDMIGDMPYEPTRDMELSMPFSVFDFELIDCNIDDQQAYDTIVSRGTRNSPLEKLLIESAVSQGEVRAEANKKAKADKLAKQISDASAQLLTVTKGITEQIDKLKLEMEKLKG